MIEVKQLSFGYGKKKKIFSDFSLSLGGGIVCGLLGKNGVGKSTLLHIISGMLIPGSGTVEYKGMKTSERSPRMLSDLFLVPEEFTLPKLKLSVYLRMMAPFYPSFSFSDMNRYLELFEMENECDLSQLSMGQKKKVFLSFAMATNSSMLLMDEPTNGLDIPSKSQFRKVLSMYVNDERSVIISTHQVADVDNLLDHIVVLDNNEVLFNDSLSAVSDKLMFVSVPAAPENALYVQQSFSGFNAIVPRDGENETNVNLEMFFNAIISEPAIRRILGKEEQK